MRQELEALHELLLEQRAVLKELLDLSHEKRQVVIRGDTQRLSEITSLLQRGVTKLKNLEKKQIRMLPELAELLGIDREKINLSGILEQTQADEREALYMLQKELGGLVNSQQEINKINRKLLEAHLEYADAMLNVLVGEEDPINNFYGTDGRASPERKKATGFFDRQI